MEKFWLRQGSRVAALVNGARWLEFAVPAVAGWCFAAGCAVLLARRAGWSLTPIVAATAVSVAVISVLGWRRMRRYWFTREDGLVRLDAVLGLHNRLSSAFAGVGDWPRSMPTVEDGFRWRWQRLVAPLVCGLAFFAAALWVPITPEASVAPAKLEMPLALTQVEAALEELKRDNVSDPEALAAMEQKLEALRTQPPDQWYSQGGLEAADALRNETGHAIASLERNLDAVTKTLGDPNRQNGSGAPIAPDKETEWNDTLKGLQSGGLPLNKNDLAELKQCNGKNGLTPQQIQALQKKLSQQAGACQSAMGKVGAALDNAKTCQGDGSQQDAPYQGTGGGGNTAQLGMRDAPTTIAPQQEQALASQDTEHTALGDVMKVTTGQHKVDPNAPAVSSVGGAVASEGSGGEAVWKSAPSPKEETVLRKYFK